MVHDRIAEELEAKGFYRRAAARWGEVMQLVETDKERHQVTMRRLECSRKAQKPPEPPDNFGDLRKAVDRTYAEMGIRNAQIVKAVFGAQGMNVALKDAMLCWGEDEDKPEVDPFAALEDALSFAAQS